MPGLEVWKRRYGTRRVGLGDIVDEYMKLALALDRAKRLYLIEAEARLEAELAEVKAAMNFMLTISA
jgi:hypothetical protein